MEDDHTNNEGEFHEGDSGMHTHANTDAHSCKHIRMHRTLHHNIDVHHLASHAVETVLHNTSLRILQWHQKRLSNGTFAMGLLRMDDWDRSLLWADVRDLREFAKRALEQPRNNSVDVFLQNQVCNHFTYLYLRSQVVMCNPKDLNGSMMCVHTSK